MTSTAEQLALVVTAERAPAEGVESPGPHQTYRHPRLSLDERPLGELDPGSLRVEMVYAGICGSDLHIARSDPQTGYILGSAPLIIGDEGRVLGHEGVGRVITCGSAVRGFSPGDLVTFESLVACLACDDCRRGAFNHCRHSRLIGLERDGLFRGTADLPAQLAHDVSDLASSIDGCKAAACIEPAACAYVATQRAAVRSGDRVVVFGAGPIGLFAAMLCHEVLGASRVDVVEPLPLRRALAAEWADAVHEIDEFFAADGPPVDVVIEASGDLGNVDRVFERLAPCARVALLARCGQPLKVSRVDHLITSGVTLVGSRGHLGGAFEAVLRLCRAGRLPLHRAITGVVEGLDGILAELSADEPLEQRHAKVLGQLSASR